MNIIYSLALFCTKFMGTQKRRSFRDIFSEFISALVRARDNGSLFKVNHLFFNSKDILLFVSYKTVSLLSTHIIYLIDVFDRKVQEW